MLKKAVLLAVTLLLIVASVAPAQGRRPGRSRYSPSRPTISPYLYLSRGTTAGVPAYYAWVRPRLELMQRQDLVDSELHTLQRELLRPQFQGTGEAAVPGAFMDLMHFYPEPNVGRR
jgi:hypothetical protein